MTLLIFTILMATSVPVEAGNPPGAPNLVADECIGIYERNNTTERCTGIWRSQVTGIARIVTGVVET